MRAWRYRRLIRWRYVLLALVLMAIAAVLDVTMMRRSTLWPDEIFSLAMATGHSMEHPASLANAAEGDFVSAEHPVDPSIYRNYVDHGSPPANFSRVTRAVFLSDTSPPLYYLLLNVWTRGVGTTDGRLRAFSVLWALASIPLLIGIARRIGGWSAALCAGVLFIASPNTVYYSNEARMYSLLWFCVVATAYLTIRVRGKTDSVSSLFLWVLASAAGLLVHYFFIFPWCAMVAYLALVRGARPRLALALCVGAVMALVLPWYWNLPESLRQWRASGDWLSIAPVHFQRGAAVAKLVGQYFADVGYWLWWEHPIASAIPLTLFPAAALVATLQLRVRGFARHRLLVLAWLAAVLAGPLAFDFVRHTYTVAVPRYVLSGLPAFLLLAGLALSRVPKLVRYLLLVAIVGAWSCDLQSIYNNGSRNDQPYWKYGQILGKEAREGDLIVVHSLPTGVIGIARYVQTRARMLDWVEQLGTRKVPESIPSLVAGNRRVFLVRIHEAGAPAPLEDWLRGHAVLVRDVPYGLSRLLEFRPREGTSF